MNDSLLPFEFEQISVHLFRKPSNKIILSMHFMYNEDDIITITFFFS